LDFTANWKDINIYSITLTRTWLGYARNIKRLYFEKDGVKISNIWSVSSDNTAIITFFPTLVINQGSTFTLDLVWELDVNSWWWEYGFSVKSASDVESDVNVIWIFPVTTYLMWVGTYSTGKIDVTNNNISINYSPWIKSATIWSFNLSASGNSDNLVFKSIKLRNTWTANIDLLWSIRLYRDNKEVSYTTSINWRDLIIHLYDTIKNNWTANYKLKADMIYCKWYDEYEYYDDEKKYKCEYELKESYKFEIRNSYDIVIIEELSWFSPTININQ
jgi:hypothetical protein